MRVQYRPSSLFWFLNPMEWLRLFYGVFGVKYPILSLILITLLGAATFGGVWYAIGQSYQRVVRRGTGDVLSDGARREQLITLLKRHASENANVKILFANIKHRPFADTLISVFQLAGWETNLTNVPLESYRHEYYQGIEVRGVNKHFVEAVADALTESGVPKVKQEIIKSGVQPTNPKWEWGQHHVRITIGHYD